MNINDKINIIYLGEELSTSKGDFNYFIKSMPNKSFIRTKVGISNNEGKNNIEDLERRSSWTYNEELKIYNDEIIMLSDIELNFKLLKYEVGDFFTMHKDHKGTHTCLIIGGSEFTGGALLLKNKSIEIKLDLSEMEKGFYMIIFSIDYYHEVTPVTKGTRFVLKTSLNKNKKNILDYDLKKEIIHNEVEDCYTDSENELQNDLDFSKLYNENNDY